MIKNILHKVNLIWNGIILYNLLNLKKTTPVILSLKSTMEKLCSSNKSIARFGDGEFNMILGKGNGFQRYEENLSKRLLDILSSDIEDQCMVALPWFEDSSLKLHAKLYWRTIYPNYRKLLERVCTRHGYANSFITRPYMDFDNLEQSGYVFEKFKDILREKRVLIVEGEGTRFGVGNTLLSNVKLVGRLLCPNINAFSHYNEIYDFVRDNASKYDLVLIALGPTATVLCWELSKYGVRAIDIGHLDIEFFWMNNGCKKKAPVPGKNVNELGMVGDSTELSKEYSSSIIRKIMPKKESNL
ncbi:GT-D fold domain-containing glycosyltransferase [Vibrio vulnificus]|uniref:GT-D fold domain-containing glycosyltransferase n=1 Tax=Vibrio vulnificus TaxID=672 RepID=UPI003EDB39D0